MTCENCINHRNKYNPEWFRSAIPGVRHSHGPPNPNPIPNPIPNPKARTVGMADPGNGGPVPPE